MFLVVLQRLITEALVDIFYFPLWWFTFGLARAGKWSWSLLKSGNEWLAPSLWISNLLVPMYGQYDWEGRIISFFMRLAQIIARLFALAFWLLFCLILFFSWILWPLLMIYGIYHSLF
jgi:hypothetical protein